LHREVGEAWIAHRKKAARPPARRLHEFSTRISRLEGDVRLMMEM
jgi:hypothetical protein